MARCGRCGLYSKYPDNHHEKKWAGACLWFQHRITEDEEYLNRECDDFFEKIPGCHPMGHFEYKLKRDNLRDAYVIANRSKIIALVSLGISVLALILKLVP